MGKPNKKALYPFRGRGLGEGVAQRARYFKQSAGGEAPSPCPLPLKGARVNYGAAALAASSFARLRSFSATNKIETS